MITRNSLGRIFVVALAVAIIPALSGCGNPKINKANVEKVKKGMTLKEVEEILGPGTKQAGGDGSGVGLSVGVDVTMGGQGQPKRTNDIYEWESGSRKIVVHMDVTGKVAEVQTFGFN